MNVRGPGARFTSAGVNAIPSALPPSGVRERSQIVRLTRDEWKRDNTVSMFAIASADRGECELT
jgi:hypothetical protein